MFFLPTAWPACAEDSPPPTMSRSFRSNSSTAKPWQSLHRRSPRWLGRKAWKPTPDPWRSALISPRKAVQNMAPYSPPSPGRAGKLRLDFNENTVGCSPRVIEFLKAKLCEDQLSIYPEYTKAKPALAAFFNVSPDELLLTNGTDEAIQVLVNTYIDDDAEVIIMRPSYAMYRFYSELAGAKIREIDYQPPALAFPLVELLDSVTPETRAILIS